MVRMWYTLHTFSVMIVFVSLSRRNTEGDGVDSVTTLLLTPCCYRSCSGQNRMPALCCDPTAISPTQVKSLWTPGSRLHMLPLESQEGWLLHKVAGPQPASCLDRVYST